MDNFAANLKEVNDRRNMEIDNRMLMIDPIMHKEVNDAIDNDIAAAKELNDPRITVICDICNHEIHPHCNNANCEDGQCWKDGEDYSDDE